MQSFLRKHAAVVLGVLSGFDRLVFRGTLRRLAYKVGMKGFLDKQGVRLKDFDRYAQHVTEELKKASLQTAQQAGREIRYLQSNDQRKEDIARDIARRDGIHEGLICVLTAVEPCASYHIYRNAQTHLLHLEPRRRKCLHLYHYQIHPVFGFMHARIQTWFPFTVQICLNGREWLARQMDQAGLRYRRYDNSFPWVEDVAAAQALFDAQLQVAWPELLDSIRQTIHPAHEAIVAGYPVPYYWSVHQSEWASDVQFRTRAALAEVYPRWLRHAITTYGSEDVLRFLGRPLCQDGHITGNFHGEVISTLARRRDGVRIKHRLNDNSIKLYDKSSVLRVETTIHSPKDFKVYRPKEGDPDGELSWRVLRKGIADLHRRAEVSEAANERYLEALAAVTDAIPLRQWAEPLCQPAVCPKKATGVAAGSLAEPGPGVAVGSLAEPGPGVAVGSLAEPGPGVAAGSLAEPGPGVAAGSLAESGASGAADSLAEPGAGVKARSPRVRRERALNPLSAEDARLLEAVSRPEFIQNGLRNRDLRGLLYPAETCAAAEKRRRSAAVTRKLRLLRAHGLIQKVPKTHRYQVSKTGRQAITALLAARNANTEHLTSNAA